MTNKEDFDYTGNVSKNVASWLLMIVVALIFGGSILVALCGILS